MEVHVPAAEKSCRTNRAAQTSAHRNSTGPRRFGEVLEAVYLEVFHTSGI